MKVSILEAQYGIDLSAQILAQEIENGFIVGDISNGTYSKDSWVDVDSLKEYIESSFSNNVLSEMHYNKAIDFIGGYIR